MANNRIEHREFTGEQIEQIVEDQLRMAGLYPTRDHPAVDLESLTADYLGATIQRASLEKSLLGLVELRYGSRPRISINTDLTGSDIHEGEGTFETLCRWRAALAHEVSHLILHRGALEFDGEQALSDSNLRNAIVIQCKKENVRHRDAVQDEREAEANRGMMALLMPNPFFTDFVLPSGEVAEAQTHLVRRLAHQMVVSEQAVRERLETIRLK
jgi:IrrE N-terminal-like domain